MTTHESTQSVKASDTPSSYTKHHPVLGPFRATLSKLGIVTASAFCGIAGAYQVFFQSCSLQHGTVRFFFNEPGWLGFESLVVQSLVLLLCLAILRCVKEVLPSAFLLSGGIAGYYFVPLVQHLSGLEARGDIEDVWWATKIGGNLALALCLIACSGTLLVQLLCTKHRAPKSCSYRLALAIAVSAICADIAILWARGFLLPEVVIPYGIVLMAEIAFHYLSLAAFARVDKHDFLASSRRLRIAGLLMITFSIRQVLVRS